MAQRPRRARAAPIRRSNTQLTDQPVPGSIGGGSGQFTGSMLVLLNDNGVTKGLSALDNATGLSKVCRASDFDNSEISLSAASKADVILLDELNVAVVQVDPDQSSSLMSIAAEGSAILAVEPERIMHAFAQRSGLPNFAGAPLQYLRGYKDAVNHLYDMLTENADSQLEEAGIATAFSDSARATWGLQATKVETSKYRGSNVSIAVLDTGFDLDHSDFANRKIVSASFVQGEEVQDRKGHGTHCIGTAMGPLSPPSGVRRYGCAPNSTIYVGKVLSNAGSGADGGILAGINWAISNKCRIISMSLGAPVLPGDSHSPIYEAVAQRALRSTPGTLIIAAAGNSSRIGPGQRKEPPNPVSRPANCPSIMAVAAVDERLSIAPFSDGGINPNGGGVDIAGPGVDIYSSLPLSLGSHGEMSGTSMATPHVAGIAALWLEAKGPPTTAQQLWQLLTGNALRLSARSRDVGAGLVQAPQ